MTIADAEAGLAEFTKKCAQYALMQLTEKEIVGRDAKAALDRLRRASEHGVVETPAEGGDELRGHVEGLA